MDLSLHQEQILGYAFHAGVSLACLTNGITWQFFLPLNEGTWENRLFYTINIEEQEIEEIVSVFNKILNKDIVISKEAIKNAKNLKQDSIKDSMLKKSIPEVWAQLLVNPTESFIDSIADKVENMCGYRPSLEQLSAFLMNIKTGTVTSVCISNAENTYNKTRRVHLNFLPSENNLERDFVTIKGVKIYTERIGSNSKPYIEEILPKLLQILPQSEILNLQDIKYCKKHGLLAGNQHPIISKREEEMYDGNKELRAYSDPIAGFWVTAQWNKKNLAKWKEYLQYLERTLK